MELAPHTERNPVRGQPLTVSADDAFDPIELYAWYLGMAINWRGRGLFLKYYLSFPVKYPSEVKQRILASFRRGLQRSGWSARSRPTSATSSTDRRRGGRLRRGHVAVERHGGALAFPVGDAADS